MLLANSFETHLITHNGLAMSSSFPKGAIAYRFCYVYLFLIEKHL